MKTDAAKKKPRAPRNRRRAVEGDLLGWLEATAYDLWMCALSTQTPAGRALYERMSKPKVGDLVMETTSWRLLKKNRRGFGRLVAVKEGRTDYDTVWTLETPDGHRCNWRNARMIAVPAGTHEWFPKL